MTDPRNVPPCLDTGHSACRGDDNVELIRKCPDRIAYVHIKQVDPDMAGVAVAEGIPFGQAVKRRVCVEPPHGEPAAVSIVDALPRLDRNLFVVVDRGLDRCQFDVPRPMIAVRTCQHLNRSRLGLDQDVRS